MDEDLCENMIDKKFELRNNRLIKKMINDDELKKISRKWFYKSFNYEYPYHFTWLGRPIIQYPQDIIGLQELMWKIKPDLIIETGIARGGSLIFSASILEMIGKGKVIGIDVEIRKQNKIEIQKHHLFKRIIMLEGSSLDEKIVKKVYRLARGKKKILLLLDSFHTHDHVLRELNLYSNLIRKDNYILVFDTIIEDMPKNMFPNRPWGKGNNPKTAVKEFLKINKNFKLDRKMEEKLLITSCPNGLLKRIK
jgi:cephalosporin hydroxylase